ncbi:MAG: 3'-5' exonuclease, partial [Candidatus Zophobacter franzmannii]|nr:3'-5' exonuclease [Candidatus Zophobacter franzmannii]
LIYKYYQKQLVDNSAMDFDDILIYTYDLLKKYPEANEKYCKQFRYIMVDEYQDTNYIQFLLIKQFATNNQNVCVVGDDDQAIYSWRGATIRNILGFEKDFKAAKIVRLEQNYRSTSSILDVSNALIEKNSSRHPKQLKSTIAEGAIPTFKSLDRDLDEASYVANDIIKKAHETYKSWQSFAILYRTNSQSRLFESTFLEKNIPYLLVGTVNFYQRKEIKNLLAYLRVLANNNDTESLLRIINTPARSIGNKTISTLLDYSARNDASLFHTIMNIDEIDEFSASIKKKVSIFRDFISSLEESLSTMTLNLFVRDLSDRLGFIEKFKSSSDPQDLSRAENLEEFLNSVDEYFERVRAETGEEPDLINYIQNVSLQTNVDRMGDKNNSVKLMTLHNAKGLEFDVVYIVGIEEDLIPHAMSQNSEDEIEEERRLFYVGITRAKKELCLTRAELRRSFGTLNVTTIRRFMDDIPEKLINKESSFSYPIISRRKRSPKPKIVLESEKQFKVGQRVRHDEYGEGLILNVDGKDIYAILTISFKSGPLKKIKGAYIEILL